MARIGFGGSAMSSAMEEDNRPQRRLRPVKTAKAMLKRDVDLLQNNPEQLGLNKSEIDQRVRDAQGAAAAQQNAQAQILAQNALAGQGFQQGAFQEAARTTQDQGQEVAAKASAQAHDLSRQIQEREANRIRAELDAARERARQNARFWTGQALDGIKKLGDGMSAMGGGIKAMQGAVG